MDTQLKDQRSAHAFNFDVMFEIITDRGVQDVHDRLSLGVSYTLGLAAPALAFPESDGKTTPRIYEVTIRGSMNRMESPDTRLDDILINFDPDPMAMMPGDRSDRVAGETNPKFDTSWEPGLDVDVLLPIGRRSYLSLGAGVFQGDPNPWFLRLGITIPVDKFIGVFTSIGE